LDGGADLPQQEKDRMDILHKFFLVARRDYLHAAPVIPCAPGERFEILDLGAGTGIWAMDMAEYV
jgi:ubiquinone/menaquinone biosynthesis C-methylase UbiE